MRQSVVLIAVFTILSLASAGCVRPASAPPAAATAHLTPELEITKPATAEHSLPLGTSSPLPPSSTPTTAPTAALASPTAAESKPTASYPPELTVALIPLAGPLSSPDAEVSGLAWYGDELVFLPQYPERFDDTQTDGSVFTLSKAEILAYLDGQSQDPLEPRAVPFDAGSISQSIPGYEGFEAITFFGDSLYATIEAHPDGMLGYLVGGSVLPGFTGLRLNPFPRTAIQPQTEIPNLSDEAIILFGEMLLTVYEANGAGVNPQPVAHLFDADLALRNQLAFPNIEYRLTDATPADEQGRFWGVNTFYIGDASLYPRSDPIAEMFAEGETHAASPVVERLLQFQFTEQGIALVNTPPLQLELDPDGSTRNWEGIARLDDRGFLLVTDEHPGTLFAFVPYPP